MTTRKLTPAEALAMFKDWQSPDVTINGFIEKWYVPASPNSFADIAIAALEEALAQKPPADEDAKSPYPEWLRKSIEDHRKWAQSVRDKDAEKLHTLMARQEPAAPVPSDEEIVKRIAYLRGTGGFAARCDVADAMGMIARRIGVQGVPQ